MLYKYSTKILNLFLILLLLGCELELPLTKTLKLCQNPTNFTATVDATNPKKYTFTLNSGEITYPISWQNSGTTLGTSTSNSFSYTFLSDGNYNIYANFSNSCGDKLSIVNNITINTELTTANSFTITAPMVHSNINAIAVTNDGTVISNENTEIKIWNYQSETLLRTLKGHTNTITDLVVSIDEKYLFSSSNGNTIIVYDWKTGTEIRRLSGHTSSINSLAISEDNRFLVSGSSDKTIKIWNISDGSLVRTINSNDIVTKVSISNNAEKIAAIWNNNNIERGFQLWNNTGQEIWNKKELFNIKSLEDIALSSDGKQLWLSGSTTPTNSDFVENWSTETKNLSKSFNWPSSGRYHSWLSYRNGYIYTGRDLINTTTNSLIYENKTNNYQYPPNSTSISSNNQYVCSSSYNGSIGLSTLSTGNKVNNSFAKHQTHVGNGYISKDGNTLITNDFVSARVWDLKTGIEKTGSTSNVEGGFYDLGLTSDGIWLRSCDLSKRSLINGSEIISYIKVNYCDGNSRIAISPNEKMMALQNSTNGIGIYNTDNGSLLKTLTGHSIIRYLEFTSDNKYLISAGNGDNAIRIWDIITGNLIKIIPTTLNQIDTGKLSLDGTLIAVGDYNNAEIYNISTGAKVANIPHNSCSLNGLSFSPDSKKLVLGSFCGYIKVYDISLNSIIKEKKIDYPIRNIYYNSTGTQLYVITQKDFQVFSAN